MREAAVDRRGTAPADFAASLAAQVRRWAETVQASGAKLD